MKRIILPNGQQKVKTKFVSVIAAVAVFASVVFILQSCKPDPKPEPVDTDPPEISSLSITEGQPGATLDIIGKNFKDDTDGVSAYFGSYEATVNSSTSSKIGCTLPDAIPEGTYTVVVSVDGKSSAAFSSFTVKKILPAANVTGFSPDNKSVGDAVTIAGTDFGDNQSIIKVTINDVEQTITAFSDNSITIELTRKTFSGEVAVWKDGVKAVAPNKYNYVETYKVNSFNENKHKCLAIDNDGNIYASTYTAEIIKYDSTGKELKKVFSNTSNYDPIGLFFAENDTLYIADGFGRILYLDPNEDEVKTLVGKDEDINIKQDYINYITGDSDGNLYISAGYYGLITKYNIHSKKSEVLFTEPNSQATGVITFIDGRIYFTTSKGVSTLKSDGLGYQPLVDDFGGNLDDSGIIFYKQFEVFFLASQQENKIYKMKYDGTLIEAVSASEINESCGYIAIDKNNDLLIDGASLKKIVIE